MSMRDEGDPGDPVLAACRTLLDSVDPVDPAGVMQARVRRSLSSSSGHARRNARRLRPALVALVAICLISIATAMFVHHRREQRVGSTEVSGRLESHRDVTATAPSAPSIDAPVAPHFAPDVETDGQPRSKSRTAAVPSQGSLAVPVPPTHRHLAVADGAGYVEAERRAPAAKIVEAPPPSPEEARLVMDELEALRVAHDPVRAVTLFDTYSARYPEGVLFEEALAYAIEAAVARNGTDAGALARRYLARFPHGRFRVIAENARERFGP